MWRKHVLQASQMLAGTVGHGSGLYSLMMCLMRTQIGHCPANAVRTCRCLLWTFLSGSTRLTGQVYDWSYKCVLLRTCNLRITQYF